MLEAVAFHILYMFSVSENLVVGLSDSIWVQQNPPDEAARHWEMGWKLCASTWPPGVELRRGSNQYQREYEDTQMKSTYPLSLTKNK